MEITTQIADKLDRLLEGQIRLEVKVEGFERRVERVEHVISAEKDRLDKRFETDVRPLRSRHDGMSFLLKTLGVLALVGGIAGTAIKITESLASKLTPASQPTSQGKDHAQVPEVRPRRRD